MSSDVGFLGGTSVYENFLYVVGKVSQFSDSIIFKYDISNGLESKLLIDTLNVSTYGDFIQGIHVNEDGVYISSIQNSIVYLLDETNGLSFSTLVDQKTVAQFPNDISVYNNKLYTSSINTLRVYEYDISSGLGSSTSTGNFAPAGTGTIAGLSVYETTLYLTRGNTDDGDVIYQYDISGGISSPVLIDNTSFSNYGIPRARAVSYSNGAYYLGVSLNPDADLVKKVYLGDTISQDTLLIEDTPYVNFSTLYWSELNDQYYQTWKEIFDEYKEVEMYFNLTLQDVIDFDFKRPVYLDTELGASLFYMNKISNYIEGKPTKCTLIKI